MDSKEKTQRIDKSLNIFLEFLKGGWILAKHPVTTLAVGLLVAFIIFLASKKEKDPVFIVNKPELVAQTVYGEEKLKIYWDNKEVKNVASVKIGFWNNGSLFIDKSDFASTDPLRIIPTEKTDILAIQALKTSRSSLQFETYIDTNAEGTRSIIIKIRGDEALEKFDGGLFHVLFSGPLKSNWKIVGRVKGVPQGFKQKDWEKIFRTRYPPRIWVVIGSTTLILGTIVFSIFMGVIRPKKQGRKIEWPSVVSLNVLMLLLFGIPIISEYSYLLVPLWLLL